MNIPRAWSKLTSEGTTPDDRRLSLTVWGSGPEEASARRDASGRLERLIERIRRGGPFPNGYDYGSRPLREEILESFDPDGHDEPRAIVTRNRYGARVLNTAHVLFLDIDLAPPTVGERLRRLIFRAPAHPDEPALAALRETVGRWGRGSFRVYRTAAGLRVIATDRTFDPAGDEARQLMAATGTDPAFARLCLAQQSFRARLTPKPWRIECPLPPGEHPRTDGVVRQQFAAWLTAYERASTRFATCRYLETIGSNVFRGPAESVVALHDRVTRCNESLPLA